MGGTYARSHGREPILAACREVGSMSSRSRFSRAAPRGRAVGRAGNPVLNWTLGIAQLVMLFLFVLYFLCVQIAAVAYLAGSRHGIVGGATPPLHLDSIGAAVTDIAAGLLCEALFAIDVLIAILVSRAAIRDAVERHRSRAARAVPARSPGGEGRQVPLLACHAPQHGLWLTPGAPRSWDGQSGRRPQCREGAARMPANAGLYTMRGEGEARTIPAEIRPRETFRDH
jgi:hypothetical protein